MTKMADITLNNQTLYLSGELDFYNVMSVYQKSLNLFNNLSAYQVDFSKLTSSDSAGIALIVEWLKLAKQHNKSIQLTNLSANLQSIVSVAGLGELINA